MQTKDRGYAIVGYTVSLCVCQYNVYVIKLDSTGLLQWTKTIGGIHNEVGYSIIQTRDNGFAIAGTTTSYATSQSDMYVIKLDSVGGLLWTKAIGGLGEDYSYSIVT